MGKHSTRKNLALRILLVAILLIGAALVSQEFIFRTGEPSIRPTPDPLAAGLDSRVSLYQSGRITIIDMVSLTNFAWDRLYLFGPYTPATYLDDRLGPAWRAKCSTQVEYSEGYTLLAFTRSGSVVHCLDYPRANDFNIPWPQSRSGLSPQQALFILDGSGRLALKNAK